MRRILTITCQYIFTYMKLNFYDLFKNKLTIYKEELNNDRVSFGLGGYNFSCKGNTADEIWDSILCRDDISYFLVGISDEFNVEDSEMVTLWNSFKDYFYDHVYPIINRKRKENLV